MAAPVEKYRTQLSVISGHVSWSAVHLCCVPSGGHCAATVQLPLVTASQATLPTGQCPHGPFSRPVSCPGCVFQGRVTIVQPGIKASSGGLRAVGVRSALHSLQRLGDWHSWATRGDFCAGSGSGPVTGEGQEFWGDGLWREDELGQLPSTDWLHLFPSSVPSLCFPSLFPFSSFK